MSRDQTKRKVYNADYNKRYYSENKEAIQFARKLKKYQLTDKEYFSLMSKQGSRCAICKCEEPRLGWAIDHCHATANVRGILCARCNLMLGYARDNIETLKAAIVYLSE